MVGHSIEGVKINEPTKVRQCFGQLLLALSARAFKYRDLNLNAVSFQGFQLRYLCNDDVPTFQCLVTITLDTDYTRIFFVIIM